MSQIMLLALEQHSVTKLQMIAPPKKLIAIYIISRWKTHGGFIQQFSQCENNSKIAWTNESKYM